MKKSIFAIAIAFAALTSCSSPEWVSLFNGKDLTGWHQVSGDATFTVEDGCIVGTYQQSKGNGDAFLVTDESFSDFILEFDYKLEVGNSGVQFRTAWDEAAGHVVGYQYEIDGNPERGWSGGMYEVYGNWLYPLTFNNPARAIDKQGDWNKGRVEAVGNRIVTFLNGKECSDLVADLFSEGVVGLQAHTISTPELEGKKVYFKNIRICTKDVEKYLSKYDENIHQVNWIANTLTDKQKADGWKLLFNGRDGSGWRSAKGETFPEEGWTIEDGMLKVWENGGAESTHGGDIITIDQYENFWLSVDFKMTKGANSGIKYFVRPDLYNVTEASAIGCEFQVLDDANHPDAHLGTADNRTLGSLYDLIKCDKSDAWLRGNQWNTAWVKVQGNHVEHWLNGVKILEYERNCQLFNALVACSKYKNWENFGNHKKGHILLQEHGNEVWFRNVIIKEFPATEEAPAVEPKREVPAKGWVDLFNGKDFTGWKCIKTGEKPTEGWYVQDGGILTINPNGPESAGDLITEKEYKNFWLSVDFKLTVGANSGIKYFINPDIYGSVGCEYQVLDDDVHPDAKLGTAGNRTASSLYDLITSSKPEGLINKYDWNTAWVIVEGDHVEHWLNGVRVVEYTRNTPEFKYLVLRSKFADKDQFGTFETGHILLQDHHDNVFYKNIKILELK